MANPWHQYRPSIAIAFGVFVFVAFNGLISSGIADNVIDLLANVIIITATIVQSFRWRRRSYQAIAQNAIDRQEDFCLFLRSFQTELAEKALQASKIKKAWPSVAMVATSSLGLVLIRQYGGYDGYRGGFYYAAEARAQAELVQYAGLLVVAICGIYALYRYISGDRYDEDIQRLVCRTLKPLPVIAVGDKVTGYGAAKIITTDADWEGVARRLMNDAKVIIFCPFPTPGATIELGILSRDYLDKTVFVMPPRNRRLKIDVGAEWNKLAKSQAPKIVLPAYSRYGGVFLMNSAGGAGENRCDFNSLFSLRNLKEAVKIVVSKRSLGADQQINIASAGGTV